MEKTILLVEDDKSDIDLALRAFRKINILSRIDVVEDGQEALDYIFCKNQYADRDPNKLPDIILLDLKLPIIDGIDVLKAIRSNPITSKIIVVILTSSNQEKDLINGYNLGVNSYLIKPVDFRDFVDLLQQINNYWLTLNKTPMQSNV
jgi:two-component system response regulator